MENKEFQEFMVEQFSKLFTEFEYLKKNMAERFEDVNKRFEDVNERFNRVDKRFEDVNERFNRVDEQFEDVNERFDFVEAQIAKLGALDHGDIEKVARQVEQLVVGQESLQDDMDYLLRRALRKKV